MLLPLLCSFWNQCDYKCLLSVIVITLIVQLASVIYPCCSVGVISLLFVLIRQYDYPCLISVTSDYLLFSWCDCHASFNQYDYHYTYSQLSCCTSLWQNSRKSYFPRMSRYGLSTIFMMSKSKLDCVSFHQCVWCVCVSGCVFCACVIVCLYMCVRMYFCMMCTIWCVSVGVCGCVIEVTESVVY